MVMLKRLIPSSGRDQLPIMGYPNNQQRNPYADTATTANIKIKYMLLLVLLPWLPYIIVRIVISRAESTASSLLLKRQSIARDLNAILLKRTTLQAQALSMHDETGTLLSTLRELGALEDYETHEMIEEQYLAKIDNMHAYFKSKSRRVLRDRFGNSPIKVALDVKVSDQITTFEVEMVGAKQMPHNVHLFLDLVDDKIYEGAIMTKKQTLLSVTPSTSVYESILEEENQKRRLVFSETSSQQNKYALCFNGLGPSIIISLEDSADGTCFGTVIGNSILLNSLPAITHIIKTRVML